MNVMKHMEAAFIFTLSVAGVGSIAIDAIPEAQAHAIAPAAVSAATAAPASANIPVVHVTAKRMSTVEKLRSLAEDFRGSRV